MYIKYSSVWEKDQKLKDWVRPVAGNDKVALCRFCKTTIRAHHRDLLDHAKTKKHADNAKPFSQGRTLFDFGCSTKVSDNGTKIAELKLAAHIACHSSVNTITHLGEICQSISGKTIQIHRTKCSALIRNVLAAEFSSELFSDVRSVPYSLIIDESTDVGTEKQLAIVVRYFSNQHSKIITTFLGIINITSGTAEAIFQAIVDFLRSKNIPIENCIGLGTDGCNTMVGQNNSVITRFREVNPNMIHIKCICHSIQLCSSYAPRVLPENVEYMVSETYSWFSHSTSRQDKYKQCGVLTFSIY